MIYLQAAKRAYLSQNERKKLISYKESVDALEKALNDDANHCHISYVRYLEAKLRKFPDGEGAMNISFSFAKGADKAIKCSLLAGKPLLMSHYLTSVQFCYNDDPENFQSKTIDISKDVRSIWDGLSYSVYDLEDVGDKFNVEELEQGCELLDFMKENLTDEADNWAKYSQELKSPSIFFNLLDNLNLMIDEITKTIDTITALVCGLLQPKMNRSLKSQVSPVDFSIPIEILFVVSADGAKHTAWVSYRHYVSAMMDSSVGS